MNYPLNIKNIALIFFLANTIAFAQENQPPPTQQQQSVKPRSAKKQMSGLKLPPATGTNEAAKDNFSLGNFRASLSEYLALIEKEPNNALYFYRAGISYLNGMVDYGKAEEYLHKAVLKGTTEKDAYFQLGRAQHLIYRFDEAIKSYEKGIEISKNKELEKRARRNIEMCKNAKFLMKNPVNVTIKNLGAAVNSPEPDYYPYIDENETFLIFNSRRAKGNSGPETEDGFRTSDVFISYEKNGVWQKPKSIGPTINTQGDEEIVGFGNNETVYLNIDNWGISGDIFYCDKKGKQYADPVQMPSPVNTEFIDITVFTNADRNIIYFASDRVGGFGGTDLYESKKLPNGEWSPAFNLGPNINSEYNEYFPALSKDGKTLYFSSEGHNGMGGFDIFKSERSETDTIWGKPENIGYPINTPDDDMEICFNKSGTEAYISSFRKGSLGDLDIYSITFNDAEANATVIKGKISHLIPIDYTDYFTYLLYEKNGETKKFPENYLPKDTSWIFKEKKAEIIKPGFKMAVFITLEKDGEEKKYALDKVPADDGLIFKDIKIAQVPIPKYKPPTKKPPANTKKTIVDATIYVAVKSTGITHGQYTPNPNSGKFIVIIPPGDYVLTIVADGFKEYSEEISVIGKGSFKEEVNKNIILKPEKPSPPIHYSQMKEGE